MTAKRLRDTKTARFNSIMGVLQILSGGQAFFGLWLSPENTVAVCTIIGMIHAMGGVYLRYITESKVNSI